MLAEKIDGVAREHHLFEEGRKVIVAVSGGADSVALLNILGELSGRWNLKLSVAHLNHGLRGGESDDDQEFVRKLAGPLPFVTAFSDVKRLARKKRISVEMAAREARYRFLAREARKSGTGTLIATAHNADDQVETIILKLARGTGLAGLCGISRKTEINGIDVIRPLLDISRGEIIRYLEERAVSWREDRSNADTDFLRNRIRHEVLPYLESRLNPRIRQALLRMGEVVSRENTVLDEITGFASLACLKEPAKTGSLDIAVLSSFPLAIRRRVLRGWLVMQGVEAETIGFADIEKLIVMTAETSGSAELHLPHGWRVKRRYGDLSVEREPVAAVTGNGGRYPLNTEGETIVPELNLRVFTRKAPGIIKQKPTYPGNMPAGCSLSPASIGRKKLYLRKYRHGDRMRPLGLGGSKKLKNIFVDGKVPADRRRNIPVLECGGVIVWVPGYLVADGWQVTGRDEYSRHIEISPLS